MTEINKKKLIGNFFLSKIWLRKCIREEKKFFKFILWVRNIFYWKSFGNFSFQFSRNFFMKISRNCQFIYSQQTKNGILLKCSPPWRISSIFPNISHDKMIDKDIETCLNQKKFWRHATSKRLFTTKSSFIKSLFNRINKKNLFYLKVTELCAKTMNSM